MTLSSAETMKETRGESKRREEEQIENEYRSSL